MRAVVYDRYGSPDVLRVEEVPMPSPAAGQVLVRVAATSVNLSDWECLRGSPLYARLGGLSSPARHTLGSDIAGWVDVVGDGVSRFRPGDEVYGDNLALKGGFAEYALVAESALTRKPAELTFAEASTIPQAGAIALQGTDGAGVGRRVLVNGGGGGSGSFAIQLAKRLGAHVTGVDNASKLDFMRSLGADDVIDEVHVIGSLDLGGPSWIQSAASVLESERRTRLLGQRCSEEARQAPHLASVTHPRPTHGTPATPPLFNR